MKLDTNGAASVTLITYRAALSDRSIIEKAIDQMLKDGIIERSQSEWCSPIVLVTKKDGTHRFCCDYRALNKITKTISCPMTVMDDIIEHFKTGLLPLTVVAVTGR
jgi:predicted transcriptional regulator